MEDRSLSRYEVRWSALSGGALGRSVNSSLLYKEEESCEYRSG